MKPTAAAFKLVQLGRFAMALPQAGCRGFATGRPSLRRGFASGQSTTPAGPGVHGSGAAADDATSPSVPAVTATRRRPLLFLDVDGVINHVVFQIHKPGKGNRERLEEYRKSEGIPAQLVCGWTDIQLATVNRFPIYYSPTVVARVNAWAEKAEIRWATSWGKNARNLLAPALGLKDFEVVGKGYLLRQDRFNSICEPGRPVVWIDDELGEFGNEGPYLLRGCDETEHNGRREPFILSRPNTLIVGPSHAFGLTEAHLDSVDAFLSEHSVSPESA